MYSEPLATFILLGLFILLLILRIPITFALIFSSIVTAIYIQIPLTAVIQKMITGIENFSLLAIPFFIVAGQIMSEGGITKRIIDFSNVIIGRYRGGLAQINVLASMFFGGVSGSAVADVSTIGVINYGQSINTFSLADGLGAVKQSLEMTGNVTAEYYNAEL